MEIRWAFNALSWKPTKQQLLSALSAVSQEENERIQKFRFQDDYKLCLIGRLMIRHCIKSALGISWKNIKLRRNEKGKPELANMLKSNETFFFNVSHQGDYTVLAASTRQNVGVDVMKVVTPNNTDIPSFFKLMRRQFVEDEWNYIYSFQKEWLQLKAFYRLWCLKESYVKAIGTGIGTNSAEYMMFDVNTRSLDINRPCSDSVLYVKNIKKDWTFSEYLLDDDHIVAVATGRKEPVSVDHFDFLTFDDFTEELEAVLPIDGNWWNVYESKNTKKY
ncbi:L-aminoadipate-semialdehyde dehydrogenase-phosphopantetheinyl transferase-like [Hydractinia symbiolongicarpus]|uniref:L-aminoadipate-semialdehyde dehydrogenase-phosphopantetheinyl transferase-like n=1 Tax=Hydractinia symbiolongicarpus TaxID=13093 RepID=UPI00254DBEEF|nr:L-aminoadipate-semialdehyde dehydrogenase-phosphopantetheinyl transferase-like [Hydractinia symbiolongicarpus]